MTVDKSISGTGFCTKTVGEIYGGNVEVPEGWEFVRFGMVGGKNKWLDPVDPQLIIDGEQIEDLRLIRDPRIVVKEKEGPRFVLGNTRYYVYNTLGLKTILITAKSIYGVDEIEGITEEEVADFRPPMAGERFINSLLGKDISEHNYTYKNPRLILGGA